MKCVTDPILRKLYTTEPIISNNIIKPYRHPLGFCNR